MAELLLRVNDKIGSTPALDARCTKRGDVIVVMPDGHVWGEREKDSPDWRIVKLPNVSVLQASAWLGEEPNTGPVTNPMRRRRLWHLDLTQLPVIAAWLADDSRQEPTITLPLTFTALQAMFRKLAPLDNPNVIGDDPNIL